MNHRNFAALLLLCLAGFLGAPSAARAAESYDACKGYITSLPVVITTEGTWCLKQDLSTSINGAYAIYIDADHVTIDCNNFKLGGLGAGAGTFTYGIYSNNDHYYLAVRRCSIRGFLAGIWFTGSQNHQEGTIIEDNRLDNNTQVGLYISGDGSVIRRNRVADTGGSTVNNGDAFGIIAGYGIDVIDNTVSGVTATAGSNGSAYGIETDYDFYGQVAGNRVRGLSKAGTGLTYGINNYQSYRMTLRGNDLVGDDSAGSLGLTCNDSFGRARDNEIAHFTTSIQNCTDVSGNDVH